MPLDETLLRILSKAIQHYDFPSVTYDFSSHREETHNSMREVEAEIRASLLANDLESVRNGLANVIYWGYARIGYRDDRVRRFLTDVTERQLREASTLFQHIRGPGVAQITRLCLPEFSGLSFVSKVRMFLDPVNYVILDRKLLKLREQGHHTLFHEVVVTENSTSIRVTEHNEMIYERWSQQCGEIAKRYFGESDVRAVDIERAIFHLIDNGRAQIAAEILANA